jgi:hypothetical protein
MSRFDHDGPTGLPVLTRRARALTASAILLVATPCACQTTMGPWWSSVDPDAIEQWYDRLAMFPMMALLTGVALSFIGARWPRALGHPAIRVLLVCMLWYAVIVVVGYTGDPWCQITVRDSQGTNPDVIAHPAIGAHALAAIVLALALWVSFPSGRGRALRAAIEGLPSAVHLGALTYLSTLERPPVHWY